MLNVLSALHAGYAGLVHSKRGISALPNSSEKQQMQNADLDVAVSVELLNNACGICPGHVLLHAAKIYLHPITAGCHITERQLKEQAGMT